MKTIFFLRHAKSSWNDLRQTDYDRPLAPRGVEAAPKMGKYIAKAGYNPQLILCSGAKRTRETLSLILPHLDNNHDTSIRIKKDFYDMPSVLQMLEMITRLPAHYDRVMIIGHNPIMEGCASMLSQSGAMEATQLMAQKFPTAALAVIKFDCENWAEVENGGYLVDFKIPKTL